MKKKELKVEKSNTHALFENCTTTFLNFITYCGVLFISWELGLLLPQGQNHDSLFLHLSLYIFQAEIHFSSFHHSILNNLVFNSTDLGRAEDCILKFLKNLTIENKKKKFVGMC